MACCGQARSNAANGTAAGGNQVAGGVRRTPLPSPSHIFEYVGETGMTVVGSGTGRTYRFANPGARQQVDLRDVRSFAAVPKMLRVG